LIRQHHREKGERLMSVIEFPARNLSPLRKRLTIVMREMMTENYPVSDIAKAWLQAGHEFAANVGDEELLDSMADLVEPIVEVWRAEARMMRANTD
jgi:hypothetical protein